jgi:16S rRNA (guanine527-N7)-methyltransferase
MEIPTLTLNLSENPSLQRYAQLLKEWNPVINLVSPNTLTELESRHFADSAQLIEDLPSQPTHIADVGTGAGFPGLVLAILCPQHCFTLIESDSRKAAFILTVTQTLGLKNVDIKNQRVEEITLNPLANIVTARAFAPLERLLPQTRHLLAKEGVWLLLKGEAIDAELKACETLFPMTVSLKPSKLHAMQDINNQPRGVVVKIQL